jgi:hypothetical protein
MPLFKSTYNILKKSDEDEVFNPSWMDSNKLILPPKTEWTYDREMQIEDVDIWEQLYYETGGIGVYVSWAPYAEFYMITTGLDTNTPPRIINGVPYWDRNIETFYGPGSQHRVMERAKQLGINLHVHTTWIDDADLWLYQKPLAGSNIF